ncbi:TetR/AcrR family transcriptional regulator [Flavisphingomonas formosensis]|uniref:TetR/AcrR family transcriptional regulator n=1 Tax=Flavisphingomonas formosensis TaxID=861534 RepID=UPI0012F85BB2|nr:TetR/AcrR family transcriptional regulator C-terminal domain-containing protein [Sphingomonas formosensis]
MVAEMGGLQTGRRAVSAGEAGSGRPPGRPRLLTVEQVVETALALGLENFSLKRIADTLGVGLATLYQYVGSRDELLQRTVSLQVERLPIAVDQGQPWWDYVVCYARGLQALLADHPQIASQFVASGFGMEAELRIADRFMRAMAARGFADDQAMRLFRAAGYITVGAAVCLRRAEVSRRRWADPDMAARMQLESFDRDRLSTLHGQLHGYTENIDDLAAELLRPLLTEIAEARGETLPERPWPSTPKPVEDICWN